MCLFATSVLQRAGQPAHGPMLSAAHLHQTALVRTPPLSGRSRRGQVHCTAVLVQEHAQATRHSQDKVPSHWQRPVGTPQGATLAGGAQGPGAPQQAPSSSTIEVHVEVQYSCQFGQHVSIVGTFQGWHVPAAVPMTWSQGDVWNVVLPVPVGTDIEYKYIVVWDDGSVARWQDGPNIRLSVQHPGVLMHVQDTWSQQDRSVREVGPRLTHDQQQKQSGGHSSDAAAGAMAAPSPSPAAQPAKAADRAGVLAAADAPATAQLSAVSPPSSTQGHGSSSSSSSSSRLTPKEQQEQQVHAAAVPPAASDVFPTVLPVQPTWAAAAAAVHQPGVLFGVLADQAAADDDELHHYEEEEEDQHWPADMLQKAAAAAAAGPAAAAAPGPTTTPAARAAAGPARKAAPAQQQPVAAAPQPAAVPTATLLAAAAAQSGQQQLAKQQQEQAAAAENLAQLLPLLRAELEAALAELLKHPEAIHEHSRLVHEGQTVLTALQKQLGPGPKAARDTKGSSSSGKPGSSAAAAAATVSSSSGTSRSPGRSPSSSLTSGDEIAAALLSDDCEEACFCMVDAICSCSDWDLDCSCESDPDTPCELSEDEDDAHVPPVLQEHSTAAQKASTARVAEPAGHTATSTGSTTTLSVAELARAAAVTALHDPATLAARAAAFTDVQAALTRSAELLQALSDPCHPLMLEADRNLATASRQLHAGHLLN